MAIMTIFARTRETTANAVPIALPASPAPAYTTSSARPPRPPATDYDAEDEDDCTDAVDDFFGVTYTSEERRARRLRLAQEATHASRDAPVYVSEPVSPVPVLDEKAALPAYATWEKDLESASVAGTLPEYCEAETGPEPFSIPQGLYKWGFCTSSSEYFLFPPCTHIHLSPLPSPAPLLVPRRAPAHQLPLADGARPAFHTRGERPPRERAAPRRTPLGETLSPCLDHLHVLRPRHRWYNVRHRDEPEELIHGPRIT